MHGSDSCLKRMFHASEKEIRKAQKALRFTTSMRKMTINQKIQKNA